MCSAVESSAVQCGGEKISAEDRVGNGCTGLGMVGNLIRRPHMADADASAVQRK